MQKKKARDASSVKIISPSLAHLAMDLIFSVVVVIGIILRRVLLLMNFFVANVSCFSFMEMLATEKVGENKS